MKTKERGTLVRAAGSFLLWVLAIVGVLSGGLWAANAAGAVQPLIVVSGSMAPEINTGDLLFATPTPAGELRIGDVATLPSSQGGVLVTHRIVELDRTGDTVTIRMQGDRNASPDGEEHVLAAMDPVWTPRLTVPGAGYVAEALMNPTVSIPLLVGMLALVALTMLPQRSADRDESKDETDVEVQASAHENQKEKVTA